MSIQRRDTQKGTRYDVRHRGPDGREVSRTFRTEREARLFEAEERSAMQRGGWVDPRSSATPFTDVTEQWIDSNPSKRPSTLARDYRTLAAIFHFAVDRDYIVRSPCRRIRLPKGPHRDVHVIDADELAHLAKAMGDYGPMVYVAAVLGLRWARPSCPRSRRLRTCYIGTQPTRSRAARRTRPVRDRR